MRTVALLWRLPLAALSLIFYRQSRALFRFAMQRNNIRHPETTRRWRVISDEMLKMPIALPAVMTTGPRWNTHAIIASVGPLEVKQSLELDPRTAIHSAKSWSVVVCTFPGMQTITHVGSASLDENGSLPPVRLSAGVYWLALRYYHWTDNPELPAVRVDGTDVVAAEPLNPAANDFYKDLPSRSRFIYLAMHYHAWIFLRYPDLFPAGFAAKQYLPLGNPDTEFYFGCTDRHESVRIDAAPEVFRCHNVYLTVYSRASFPLISKQITETENVITPQIPATWLVRVHGAFPGAGEMRRDWVVARTVS